MVRPFGAVHRIAISAIWRGTPNFSMNRSPNSMNRSPNSMNRSPNSMNRSPKVAAPTAYKTRRLVAAPTAYKTPHNFLANSAKFFGLISVKCFGHLGQFIEFFDEWCTKIEVFSSKNYLT